GGAPAALNPVADVSVDVRSEPDDDGTHGIWFNRGIAGSQAFVKHFGQYTPPVDAGEGHPAFAWLSRRLGEALLAFVGRASGAVWSGATSRAERAIFGHLNVGHLENDPDVAARFRDYWTELADDHHDTGDLRTWDEAHNEVDLTVPPPAGLTTVFSPRATTSTLLDWYATTFDGASSSAHITGAFGLHKVFRDLLGQAR